MSAPQHTIDKVDLWLVDLDAALEPDAERWLSATEREREARFVFATDKHRYRAAHTHLRKILWERCGVPPGTELVGGTHGKPYLRLHTGPQFNLSHSHALALIGVGSSIEVGVDIEVATSIDDVWSLATTYFTPAECASLRRMQLSEIELGFLEVWTRKEACLKAIGSGFSIDPSTFEVGLASSSNSVCVIENGRRIHLSVHSIELDSRVRAAVACIQDSRRSRSAQ